MLKKSSLVFSGVAALMLLIAAIASARNILKLSREQSAPGKVVEVYEAGEEVTVLYDPQHPLDARIKSFGSSALMWVLPGISGMLGAAFLGGVMAVQKFMPEE